MNTRTLTKVIGAGFSSNSERNGGDDNNEECNIDMLEKKELEAKHKKHGKCKIWKRKKSHIKQVIPYD